MRRRIRRFAVRAARAGNLQLLAKLCPKRENGESALAFSPFLFMSPNECKKLIHPFFFVVQFPLTCNPFLRRRHDRRLPFFQVFDDRKRG